MFGDFVHFTVINACLVTADFSVVRKDAAAESPNAERLLFRISRRFHARQFHFFVTMLFSSRPGQKTRTSITTLSRPPIVHSGVRNLGAIRLVVRTMDVVEISISLYNSNCKKEKILA
jgi:hypothetical protein